MKGCNYIFYTPELQYPGMPHGEMCGDLMPFFHDGKFLLVYLYKYCIYAVETTDFVHYGEHRLVLQNGTPDEQDWHAATGSVCRGDDQFYFYYTGFCEGNRGEPGKYEQAILRAVSRDLIHWEKDPEFFFPPDEARYAGRHWRDPDVFWNEELGKYCMLVTACEKDGAVQRSGCTAVYVSEDIRNWAHYGTICSPRIYPTMECQDCFRMGDRWYLVYSTYEKQWETRYKTAEFFDGPWTTPAWDDKLDGRDFYAAKTVSDGEHRYLVGWQAIRKDCSNQGRYVWGGNVVVHELVQRTDGGLGVKLPDTIRDAFSEEVPLSLAGRQGEWTEGRNILGTSEDGFGWAELAPMPRLCLVKATLKWSEGTQAAGVMFHTEGERLEKWCQLRLEPTHGRIVLERSGKTEEDQFFEEERRIVFENNQAEVTLLTFCDMIVAYVNDVALCGRCYGANPGKTGLFVEYGSVQASGFTVYQGEQEV